MTAQTPSPDATQRVIDAAIRERERHTSGKTLRSVVIALLVVVAFGILLIVLGAGHPNDDSAPTCDGQTMSTDDVCAVWTNGSEATYSYQDLVNQRHAGSPGTQIFGWVVIGVTLLISVPVVRAFRPSLPWGTAVSADCPRCGRPDLREKPASVSRRQGRTRITTSGIVTLCTPACGYRAVRRSGTPRG